MIRSMTGFGRGEYKCDLYNFKVEIKAVNHRYNDISVRLPRHISYLEEKIKKDIRGKIKRGKVDVFINLEYINESSIEVIADIDLARSYKDAFEKLSGELKIDDSIKLGNIINIPDVIKTERKEVDEDIVWNSLKEALDMALIDIVNMKEAEGKALKEDMLMRLKLIEDTVVEIEKRSPLVVEEYKEKLKERLEVLLDKEASLDEDRIAQEVVFFADKCNIDEEIVRLKSHVNQYVNILEELEPVGRKLDFLIQEMNREINTIGSKANDMIISKNVVEVKSEIEKMREQVQNIE